MSNKNVVDVYIEGFNESNHDKILACLTDDVVWDMPGYFHLEGKKAFDDEIENDAFIGKPTVITTRLLEEGNIVVAEGSVKAKMKNGGMLDAVFCDVFHFRGSKIEKLTSYLMHNKKL